MVLRIMMRLPSATSLSNWQTLGAVRGEVVFNSFRFQVIACQLSCGMKWRQQGGRSFGPMGPAHQLAKYVLHNGGHISSIVDPPVIGT
jgi:hypothetical protein